MEKFLVDWYFSNYQKIITWQDPRTKGYLMDSPLPCIFVAVSYFIFIFKIGPNFMKRREPYNCRNVILVYNFAQIILNCIGLVLAYMWYPYVSFFCTPIDKYDMTLPHWLYFLLKTFDLLDTVFHVLRKNYRQITILHLYHHSFMFIGTWVSFVYFPGGQLYFVASINCFIHSLMYFYYFLTSWDPKHKKKIWWKRHLTELQIIQHCIIFLAFLMALCNPWCDYPKPVAALVLLGTAVMIYLFVDFYIHAYVRKK